MRLRETWGFVFGKFLTTPIWMLYLWWLPTFLADVYSFPPHKRAWAVSVVYLMADVGSVAGGWLSGFLMRRGFTNDRARKISMAACALCMPLGALAVFAPNPILAVGLISIAAGAHQGWSANLFTTVTDVFPKQAVGSVISIGSLAGALGSFLFASIIAGHVVARFGYKPRIPGRWLVPSGRAGAGILADARPAPGELGRSPYSLGSAKYRVKSANSSRLLTVLLWCIRSGRNGSESSLPSGDKK